MISQQKLKSQSLWKSLGETGSPKFGRTAKCVKCLCQFWFWCLGLRSWMNLSAHWLSCGKHRPDNRALFGGVAAGGPLVFCCPHGANTDTEGNNVEKHEDVNNQRAIEKRQKERDKQEGTQDQTRKTWWPILQTCQVIETSESQNELARLPSAKQMEKEFIARPGVAYFEFLFALIVVHFRFSNAS